MHNKRILKFSFLFTVILFTYACNEAKFMQGKRTYDVMCGDCHMEDGSGVAKVYPELNAEKIATLIDDLPCIIRYGVNKPASLIKMPPNPSLLPVDITNIINYLCNDMHDLDREFTMVDIISSLNGCPKDSIR